MDEKFREDLSTVLEKYILKDYPYPFLVLDRELNILFHNRACSKVYGKKTLGKTFFRAFMSDEKREEVQAIKEHSTVEIVFYMDDRNEKYTFVVHRMNDQFYFFAISYMLIQEKIVEKMAMLNNEMTNINRELKKKNRELKQANEKIKTLDGLLPICSKCHKIRSDEEGYWETLENYIRENTRAELSHSLCPTCIKELYPGLHDKK